MDLSVSVQARENHTAPLIGLGAVAVDLKFASLNIKVRLIIGARVMLPYFGISSQI